MPTLRDHERATFSHCRRVLPDRIGCGGFVFWGQGDGPAGQLGLEGCCSHCGTLWYTGDILAGTAVVQPQPIVRKVGRQRGQAMLGRSYEGRRAGGWRSLNDSFFKKTA